MRLIFSDNAWDDYLYWQKTDKKMVRRINMLIKECARDPFGGIGRPEPLKHALAGHWSRRIDESNRSFYKVIEDDLLTAQPRYHC